MTYKLTALTVAIIAGLAVPALADRGFGGGQRGGMDARPSFAELDTNGDGALTVEEMTGHRQAMFSSADTDGNGELTAEELSAAAAARMQAKAAERATRMVEHLDTDGNGTVSLAELEARDKGDRMEKMFNRLDADDDGAITAEEFSALQEHGPKGGHGKWRGYHGGGAN